MKDSVTCTASRTTRLFISLKFKLGSFFTVTEYDTEPEEAAELDDEAKEESEEEMKAPKKAFDIIWIMPPQYKVK